MGIFTSLAHKMSESRAQSWSGAGLQNPEPWLLGLMGTGDTAAGMEVTYDSAYGLAAWWACAKVLTEDVGKISWHAYRRLPGGGRERATGHPVYRLVHTAPNPEQTPYEFKCDMTGHLVCRGNAYAWIVFDKRGYPTEMWPLDPVRMEVFRKDGKIYYKYHLLSGGSRTFLAWEIFHLKTLSMDGLTGMDLITYARESIAAGLAVNKYGASFFGNSANPSGYIKMPDGMQKLSVEGRRRLLDGWNLDYQGPDNFHKTAVLEGGAEWRQVGIAPENAQWIETKKISITEFCSWFRMPPHKVQYLGDASFNNIEHMGLAYGGDTILPLTTNWQQKADQKLFSEADRDEYYTEFLLDTIYVAEIRARYEAHERALKNGWKNRDEIRALENLNPLPGGMGKIFMIDGTNMKPLDKVIAGEAEPPPEPPAPPPADDDEDEDDDSARALAAVLDDAMERIRRREERDGERLDMERHREFCHTVLGPYARAHEALTGQAFDISEWFEKRKGGQGHGAGEEIS